MKNVISLFVIFVIGCSSSAIALGQEVSNKDIKYPNLNYSEYPIDLAYVFKSIYKSGPNFNGENYLFAFSCGGSAICIGAYSDGENDFSIFQ